MWKKYLSLLVIGFGLLGYFAGMGAEILGITAASPIYDLVLLVKELFFSALKMLVAPIIFFSLLSGMIQISEVSQLGNMGKYTLMYYFSTTCIAIVIGLIVVFFIHPWENVSTPQERTSVVEQVSERPARELEAKDASSINVVRNMVKRVLVNPVDALVNNNVLSIVFWAFLIGVAFMAIGEIDNGITNFITQANLVLNKILGWVILGAPIGVFAIAFDFQYKFAGTILSQLLAFMAVVFSATMVHGLIVLPTILKYFTGIGPKEFFTKASKALVLAFSTSSSSATLPVSLQVCEEEFKADKKVSSFVLPLGATMNMDGTALFEGIAAVFLASLFAMDLSTGAMLSVFFMAVVSSIGAPGMPSGSMSGMQMVLLAAGIPLEGIGVLMVVERPLDTFRTAVNVQGDIGGALIVDHVLQGK
ncbi:MAG: Na+:H+ dicarboxylate symporter [Bdellovibrionaceae bacterium]|nr:Na+:H+ dicarboxylate symporter [Pseudobdellovibrionaceae bacterium]|tara:strand:- start:55840 stop:57096 length:1257 start_codon:yes stop_codon:yes gene_type:complete